MKRLIVLSTLVPVLLAGCTKYAMVEQVRVGMTSSEFAQLETPCFYRGQSDKYLKYSCKFDVPSGYKFDERLIRPYIVTFKNGRLSQITLDERELDRDVIRYQDYFYYPPTYGYRNRYFYRGYRYPYYYP